MCTVRALRIEYSRLFNHRPQKKFITGWYDSEKMLADISEQLANIEDRHVFFKRLESIVDAHMEFEQIATIVASRNELGGFNTLYPASDHR